MTLLLLPGRVAAAALTQSSPSAGYDNSAPQQKGLVLWDKDPKYPAQTLAVVTAMAKKFSAYPALLGFNLLDSPVVRSMTAIQFAHLSVCNLQIKSDCECLR